MPFCANCGTQYDEGVKFCPGCGTSTAQAQAQAQPEQPTYQAAPQQEYQAPQQGYQAPQQGYQQPAYQAAAAGTAFTGNKTMAILAIVFPVLFFLPLVTGDKTEFDRFWANQALLLLIIFAIGSITAAIIIGIFISIFAFVLWIIGLIAVCNGQMKPLPLVGKITIIK